MRAYRAWAAPLLAVVLWTAGVAPLLASDGGGLMPCCAEGRPCDTALKATGCCRIDAASERAVGVASGVARHAGSFKDSLAQAPATPASGAPAPPLAPATAMAEEDPPPRGVAVPLYQLNSTLLR